jgi:hypothetical protein
MLLLKSSCLFKERMKKRIRVNSEIIALSLLVKIAAALFSLLEYMLCVYIIPHLFVLFIIQQHNTYFYKNKLAMIYFYKKNSKNKSDSRT